MSGLTNKALASPNFAFLMQYDEVLVRHVALAERYIFDDPNSALIKLRQFGELLAQHAAAYAGVAVEAHETQREVIDKLWDRQIINAQASQLFHGLRKAGNEAAHQHSGDRREALHQLQMARKLAIWFHKLSVVLRTSRQVHSSHPRIRVRPNVTFVLSLNVCAKRWLPRKTRLPERNNWRQTTLDNVKRPRLSHNARTMT